MFQIQISYVQYLEDVDREGDERVHIMEENYIHFLLFGDQSIHCGIHNKLQIPTSMCPPSFCCSLNFVIWLHTSRSSLAEVLPCVSQVLSDQGSNLSAPEVKLPLAV